jgi:hypothetical protein
MQSNEDLVQLYTTHYWTHLLILLAYFLRQLVLKEYM